jgi:phosphoglycerol transferase MdoB-like AlkP superfamily enzyme
MEDVPEILDYGKEDARFGWDHETYQFALDRMDRLGGPFLVVTFSGTNHTPYPDPGERFHVGPHQRKGENGYRNCLHYSDWALGEFMRGARAKSWFANTLFLFSADHPWRTSGSDDLREWFRIPFLMLGSGVEPGVDKTVGSQVDLLPTMLEALGFPEPFSALGRSLLSGEAAPVLVKKGVVVGMISDGAWLQHSLRERLGQGWFGPGAPPAGVFETLERRLLAVSRVTYDLITSNRWAR